MRAERLPRHPNLGKPANFTDRIVERRISLLEEVDGFVGSGLTLVDVGCGNGASTFLLANRMKECVGIDVGEGNRNSFEEQRKVLGLENCRFLQLDVENDPVKEKFDRLISFEVVEHLKDERSVGRFFDLLERGGLGAISVPNKWWIFETHGARLPGLPWNRVPFFSWLPRRIHERYAKARIYTKKRICGLLSSVGFEILDWSYITAPMDVLPEGALKSALTRTVFRRSSTRIPFLATSILVIVRKPAVRG